MSVVAEIQDLKFGDPGKVVCEPGRSTRDHSAGSFTLSKLSPVEAVWVLKEKRWWGLGGLAGVMW